MSTTMNSQLSALGLGTSRLSSFPSALSAKDADRLIRTALDHGVRVLDTADAYGSGDAERTLGRSLRGRREEAFVISKGGLPYVSLPGGFSPLNQIGKKLLQRAGGRKNYSKTYLLKGVQRTLRRLQTNNLDAFLLHEPEADEVSDASFEALEEIRARGWARFVGVATSSLAVLKQAFAFHVLDLVETPVSWGDAASPAVLQFCCTHGVPVIGNQALKALRTLSANQTLVEELAREQGIVPARSAEVLVRWAAAQPAVATVLVGTQSAEHLLSNLGALRRGNAAASLPVVQEVTR